MAHELVRPQADRLLLEAVVADLLDVPPGHHPARRRRRRAVEGHEVGEGLVEVEAHAVGIDDRDLAHLVLERPGPLVALEAELHVLGGERVPVVELQPLAQLELVRALIGADRPRLGQAGGHEIARHRLHERVVDRVEHPERRELSLGFAGIEPLGRQRHVEGPAHLAVRLGRRGLRQGDAREDGVQHDSDGRHEAPGHGRCGPRGGPLVSSKDWAKASSSSSGRPRSMGSPSGCRTL